MDERMDLAVISMASLQHHCVEDEANPLLPCVQWPVEHTEAGIINGFGAFKIVRRFRDCYRLLAGLKIWLKSKPGLIDPEAVPILYRLNQPGISVILSSGQQETYNPWCPKIAMIAPILGLQCASLHYMITSSWVKALMNMLTSVNCLHPWMWRGVIATKGVKHSPKS